MTPAPDTSAFTRQFVEEARDRLKSLGDLLLKLEAHPDSPGTLADIFREAHSLKGSAGMLGFLDISQIAHQLEDLLAAAKREARIIDARAIDLIFRTIDVMSARVEQLAKGKVPAESTASAVHHVPAAKAETPIETAPARPGPDAAPSGRAALASLRVSVEKLESLTHLAPEMVIQRLNAAERHAELRRLELAVGRLRDRLREQRLTASARSRPAELGHYADALDAIHRRMRLLVRHVGDDHARLSLVTEELRQQVMDLTMLPVSTVFDAFPRAVRDLAKSCGKEIELTMAGGDTALDKRVIEQISEPLVHLIRNAVDHGLESAVERAAAGKPPGGLHIAAEQHGNRIRITVRDDGRGIDAAAVRAAAIGKGVVSEAQVAGWDDDRLRALVFEPGFSTRAETTDVSGRGVGMDIVRVVAERLGGSVRVQSEVGRGTTVSLDLPLSLALLRVVLVDVCGEVLAVPTAPIRRILRVPPALRLAWAEGALIDVDGEPVPLTPLGVPLGVPGATIGDTALLVDVGGAHAAFAVDLVREEQELVFQKLHGPIQQETIAGAAILGNGDIVPILDVQALLARVTTQHAETAPASGAAPAQGREVCARVLIVEDSLVTGELLKGILVAAGYESVVAHHGREAIDMLQGAPWDLVISDVDMPEMDGFELTQRVRADPALRHIPVIMVTSRDSDEYRRMGLAAGADEYVTKGAFDQHHMLDAVKRLVAGPRIARDPSAPREPFGVA